MGGKSEGTWRSVEYGTPRFLSWNEQKNVTSMLVENLLKLAQLAFDENQLHKDWVQINTKPRTKTGIKLKLVFIQGPGV